MAALFSALALLCALDAVFIAALAKSRDAAREPACGGIIGAILACAIVCLVAAGLAR